MSRARERAHLVRVDDDKMVSSEVGIMHPSAVTAGFVLLILLFLVLLGGMIWACVVFADEKPYYPSNATTDIQGNYIVYFDRAAEPYCGKPARVLTGVTTVDTCTANCSNDTDCRFFTYDQTNGRCYLYDGGILPEQFVSAAVPGPTQLDTDVYVKSGSIVAQLRGVLQDGNQTLL